MKFNALVPELGVVDINKSLSFYVNVLGFKIEYERKENNFAYLSYGNAQIMIEQINNNWFVGELEYPLGRGVNFQIETNEISKIVASLKKHKVKPYKELFESCYRADGVEYHQKELLVQDPDGYLLRFAQDL